MCARKNPAFAVIANEANPAAETGVSMVMDWIWSQTWNDEQVQILDHTPSLSNEGM